MAHRGAQRWQQDARPTGQQLPSESTAKPHHANPHTAFTPLVSPPRPRQLHSSFLRQWPISGAAPTPQRAALPAPHTAQVTPVTRTARPDRGCSPPPTAAGTRRLPVAASRPHPHVSPPAVPRIGRPNHGPVPGPVSETRTAAHSRSGPPARTWQELRPRRVPRGRRAIAGLRHGQRSAGRERNRTERDPRRGRPSAGRYCPARGSREEAARRRRRRRRAAARPAPRPRVTPWRQRRAHGGAGRAERGCAVIGRGAGIAP